MKMLKRKSSFNMLPTILLVLAITTSTTLGAGFSLYETSARGVAMGGALIGDSHDATAVYNNPAMMTSMESDSLVSGISLINPGMDIDITTPAGRSTYTPDNQWFPPPFFYITKKLNDDLWFGLGINSLYGLGVRHDKTWPGRYNSVETKITTFNVNPNIAWKINDKFSVAAGVSATYLDVIITKMLPLPGMGDALLDMRGDGMGFGANAALSYKITDDFVWGLVYRSETWIDVNDADVEVGGRKTGKVNSEMTLPQNVTLGFNYTGLDRWNFGAAATWTAWSSYDRLTFDFKPALLGKIPSSTSQKQFNDVWRFGFGAEYQLSDITHLQAGLVIDEDPSNSSHRDYLMPPGDRMIYSLGLRTEIKENWEFGISYGRIVMKSEDIEARPAEGVFPTTFKDGHANIITVSLGTTF